MGILKDMLEATLKGDIYEDDNELAINHHFKEYEEVFKNRIGQTAIWKTMSRGDSNNVKKVVIEGVYSYFVMVSRVVKSVDSTKTKVKYAINYTSLLTETDTLEFKES